MKNITIIAGARPNFMKIAPIINQIENKKKNGISIEYKLIHTGQHFDKNMSGSFFLDLQIPKPDVNLNCISGSHSQQTADIMCKFENYLLKNRTDLVLVVGDVNSTLACSIVSQKLGIKVAHVEAGIRSNDWSMPEEINRLVTDSISNYFFTTSEHANLNLINSGIDKKKIFFVGNTMIDTLLNCKNDFKKPSFWSELRLKSKTYAVMTLHRPANVDKKNKLKNIINSIIKHMKGLQIVFPVHPRTRNFLEQLDIQSDSLYLVEPLSYLKFNYLVKNALVVITDSGGITEETTVLGVPCMTVRDNTERPETINEGTNELIGTNPQKFSNYFDRLFSGQWKKGKIPDLWDGKTSSRIVDKIIEII